jgi:hypothetical protein
VLVVKLGLQPCRGNSSLYDGGSTPVRGNIDRLMDERPSDLDVVVTGKKGSMLGAAELLTQKARALFDAGQYAGAIACCDQLIEQFSEAEERELRRPVFRAFSKKASALVRLGRLGGTEATFDQLCVWLASSSAKVPMPADRVDLLRALARKDAGQPERAVTIAD